MKLKPVLKYFVRFNGCVFLAPTQYTPGQRREYLSLSSVQELFGKSHTLLKVDSLEQLNDEDRIGE